MNINFVRFLSILIVILLMHSPRCIDIALYLLTYVTM